MLTLNELDKVVKEKQASLNIRLRTFHVLGEDSEEIGKITSARKFDEDGSVIVAFSFCSPKDRFSKTLGRIRAVSRLLEKPKKRYRTYNGSLQEMKDLAVAVAEMRDIKWMKKAKFIV